MVRKNRKICNIPAGYKGRRWRGMRICPRYKKCGKMFDHKNDVLHYNDLGFCSPECREKYIEANTIYVVPRPRMH